MDGESGEKVEDELENVTSSRDWFIQVYKADEMRQEIVIPETMLCMAKWRALTYILSHYRAAK